MKKKLKWLFVIGSGITFTFLIWVLPGGTAAAHSGKPKYHVIIDTDGAVDDMRAISMLLSGNEIRVVGITCSQGTLMPDQVYEKVTTLLELYHHEGIPVGTGEITHQDLPPWSGFAQEILWGEEPEMAVRGEKIAFGILLNRVSRTYPDKITLIAMGSLETYADWIRGNPGIADRVERIIWYNNHDLGQGFNYRVSPDSYEFIRNCGIPLEIVANESTLFPVNQAYLDQLQTAGTAYADQIMEVHSTAEVTKRISEGHLQLWDDLLPLYLNAPLLFSKVSDQGTTFVSLDQNIPSSYIYEMISKLLASGAGAGNRVFLEFPVDTILYKSLYADMVTETIRKFGMHEWKAVCLTNEIHGHTGIYSIIGAKMGIRAMEYFNVGVNNLKVKSFAGSNPPLSCFNDGIQISTGATIGQGLISIADSVSAVPSATFEFNNQKIHMALSQELSRKMQEEIAYGVATYGLQSAQYWLYIEELAARYWADFDRHDIFHILKVE